MSSASVSVIRKHLRRIERAVERQLKDQTTCCGVTSAQCHALLELSEAGEQNLAQLSEQLQLDTSTLSRTVDGLVKAGYVDRITDPENRRSVRLGLTGKGKRKVEFINRASDDFYLDLLRQVPAKDFKALASSVALLADVFTRCREEGRCGAARAGTRKVGKHAGQK